MLCSSLHITEGPFGSKTGIHSRHKILLDRRQLLVPAGVSLWVLFRLLPQEPTASFPGEASRPLLCHLGRSKPPDTDCVPLKGDVAQAATGGSGVLSCSVQGRGVSLGQFSLIPPRGREPHSSLLREACWLCRAISEEKADVPRCGDA